MIKEKVLDILKEARVKKSEVLILADCGLDQIPNEVFDLVHLKSLSLKGNNLQSIPKEIKKLANLVSLSISNNEISELPDELFELQNLETLSIKQNKVKVLPNNFGKLKRLSTLSAIGCGIELIEDGFCNLKELKSLYLRKNKIKRLPKTFGNLLSLKNLTLDSNPIEYPNPEIVKAGLMRIMIFFLINEQSQNNLSGFSFKVPSEMKTAVKQYLVYFQEYVEKSKGKKIIFEVKSTEDGVLIETSENDDLKELNNYFNEYLSFVKSNIDDLKPQFEVPLSETKKELVVLELKQQVFHFKQQLELKNFQIKFLEKQVDDYYNLLTIQNSKPLPIYLSALSNSTSQSVANSTAKADISIDLSLELPNLKDIVQQLKNDEEVPVELKNEIQTIDTELLDVEPDDAESIDKKPLKRIKRIFEQLTEEDSSLNKAVHKSKQLKEKIQKLGKSYNKFAQWLALPVIPDLLLEI